MKAGLSNLIRNDTVRTYVRIVADVFQPRATEWRRQIEQAYLQGDWERVVDIVPEAMRTSITLANPGNYLRLAQGYARLRRNPDAAKTLEAGIARFPWSQVLLRGAAELAMSRERWSESLGYWQRALDAPEQNGTGSSKVGALPQRGTDFDWYELAWRRIVAGWDQWWKEAAASPLPVTYLRVFKVLQVCGDERRAAEIALLAFRDYPQNHELLLQMLPSLADHSGAGGIRAVIDAAQKRMTSPLPRDLLARLDAAERLLDDLEVAGPTSETELRMLTVRKGSSYETIVRAGNIWGEHRIRHATRKLAERDNWPERESPTDRVSDAAWLASRRFARGRGREVGVSDDALARAVFHFVKHEIVLRLPVDRLAREIVAESGGRPILIELKSLTLRYLVSYPSSPMQVFYLYDALRALGANVQFVHFVHQAKHKGLGRLVQEKPVPMALRAKPQVTEIRPRRTPLVEPPETSKHLIVPSGIRSVTRLIDRLDEAPIVLNSGAVISEYAYDRTKTHRISYDVHTSLHPATSTLPGFVFETELRRSWNRIDPTPGAMMDAWLSVGTVDTRDWEKLFAEAMLPYFAELVRGADELFERHGVTDVHIGDYLYAEPSLIADRMRSRGGRVHVWPHSSNPVHVKYHAPEELATVHCITESGASIWRESSSGLDVRHESSLMISQQAERVEWQEGAPVSLVVMGGRPVMRNLPILSIERHEQAYRDLFTGLEGLVRAGKVRVYFKPRGLSGEFEGWLEEIVGRAADWERELAHPMRLTLPNPVYASVSVGSSALLEGAARGVPGLIVREQLPVREYLSVRRGGIEVLNVPDTVNFLESLTVRENWEAIRSRQQRDLAEELGMAAV
ncbi:tetratricopeptide repeat protein [Leucobacter sp. GX24907]